MENIFTVFGGRYRMYDPASFNADLRIQQERKTYFKRLESKEREKFLSALTEEQRAQEEDKGVSRFLERIRFAEWQESIVDTSLDDILMVTAMLEPLDGATRLTPEMILEASAFQVKEEVLPVANFFRDERNRKADEYAKSKEPSNSILQPAPTTETSSLGSTSP